MVYLDRYYHPQIWWFYEIPISCIKLWAICDSFRMPFLFKFYGRIFSLDFGSIHRRSWFNFCNQYDKVPGKLNCKIPNHGCMDGCAWIGVEYG